MRTLASICFASIVGRWVDDAPHRLKTLSSTITVNRISVIAASALWFFIVGTGNGTQKPLGNNDLLTSSITPTLKGLMFTLILLLGIFETLSANGNSLSMERDFVVTAADPDGQPYDLTHLNAVMRRIDLICKLIAPILISVMVSSTSVKIGVLIVGGMSGASWGIELLCAKRVWDINPKLRTLKSNSPSVDIQDPNELPQRPAPHSTWHKVSRGMRGYAQDFKNYFSSPVWIPSMSLSLLHLSALAYSATFITFLLNVGFSLDLITIARAAGSIVEISSE